MFVNNLKAKMSEYNLETVYLASPPNNIDLIRLLNSSFPGNFFYMDDVMKFSNKTMGPEFLDNNYKASFVEQEIGFRSTFYLGASLSSWTQTVLTDRLARNNKKHDSVLKIVTNGAPGYPELVFQFPEGNFNFGGMIAGKKSVTGLYLIPLPIFYPHLEANLFTHSPSLGATVLAYRSQLLLSKNKKREIS